MGQNEPVATYPWTGASGQTYHFQIDPIWTHYKPVPGVYMFCKRTTGLALAFGPWIALYVGETHDFHERLHSRLDRHDAYECVTRNGATHIATLRVHGAANRLRIETDLRHSIAPVCNLQSVPYGNALRGFL